MLFSPLPQPSPHPFRFVQAFSFGVCLYEMIAAKDPWEGETHGQVAYQVRTLLQIHICI
jgi:hypothetical protein